MPDDPPTEEEIDAEVAFILARSGALAMSRFHKSLAEARLAQIQRLGGEVDQLQAEVTRLKEAVVQEAKAANHWFTEAQRDHNALIRAGLK